MANEIKYPQPDTVSVTDPYVIIVNESNGQVVKTADGSQEAYATANRALYAVHLTEQGTASKLWYGDMPAGVAAGDYSFVCYDQTGGGEAETDTFLGKEDEPFHWSGSAYVPLYHAPVNAAQGGGTDWNSGAITANTIATGAVDADAVATDAVQEIRNAITGGAYALDTDANGRVRIVDGTGAGELDTLSGTVLLRSANETKLAALTFTNSNALDVWLKSGILHGGANTRLGLDSVSSTPALSITSSGGDALYSVSSGGNGHGAYIEGNGTGDGMHIKGGATSSSGALYVDGFTNGLGLLVSGGLSFLSGNWTISGSVNLNDLNVGGVLTATNASNDIRGIQVNDHTSAALSELRSYLLGQDTSALQTDASGYVKVSDGTGQGQIGLTGGYIDGIAGTLHTLDSLNNLSAAQVNAEVVDALVTDTYGQPSQGAPAATLSLKDMIRNLHTSWRNKKTNDGSYSYLYDDAGTTVLMKQQTSSAGGTVTKAEWITGP